MWPLDLPYYVERYHVVVPDEFVEHMKRNEWRVPAVSEERLVEIDVVSETSNEMWPVV